MGRSQRLIFYVLFCSSRSAHIRCMSLQKATQPTRDTDKASNPSQPKIFFSNNLVADPGINTASFREILALVNGREPSAEPQKPGICLQLDTALKNQDFYISSNKENALIRAASQHGFQRGFNFLCQNSGIELGGYSDKWLSVNLRRYDNSGQYVSSYCSYLDYFPTGGLGSDKTQTALYNRHHLNSGFFGPYYGIGHAFHTFYTDNKAIIDADPSLVTNYNEFNKNGTRRANDPNLDHPGALHLIKTWVYKKIDKNPAAAHISLGTADGMSNQPEKQLPKDPQLSFLTNLIDKYMYIVNQVAKSIKEDRPNWKGLISYNAYGNGTGVATPPAFPLEDNIIVQMFTTFQRDFKTPEAMFQAWQSAHPNIVLQYGTHWLITQWMLGGLPNFNVFAAMKNMIPLLKQYNITNFKIENNAFSITMNPHWWVMARALQFDTSTSLDKFYSEYFRIFFPGIESEAYEFYYLLSTAWCGQPTLPFLIERVEDMWSKAQDSKVQDRIIEIMSYIIYLVKYYETKEAWTEEASIALEEYAARLNNLGTLQSWAVYAYDYGDVKTYSYKGSPVPWATHLEKFKGESWKELSAYLISEFKAAVQNYPILYYIYPYNRNVLNVANLPKAAARTFHTYNGSTSRFEFNVANNQDVIFKWTPKSLGASIAFTDNDLVPEEDTLLVCNDPAQVGKVQNFIVPALSGRVYQIVVNTNSTIVTPPGIACIYKTGAFHSGNGYNNWYFYVPKDQESIVFSHGERYSFTKGRIVGLQKPDGKGGWANVAPPVIGTNELGETLYQPLYEKQDTWQIDIAPEDRGKVWRVFARTHKWKFLNLDPILSTAIFSYSEEE